MLERLPLYRSTKLVRAGEITHANAREVVVDVPGFGYVALKRADHHGLRHPDLAVGWFVVAYANGYISASPSAVFHAGHERLEPSPGDPGTTKGSAS